MDNKRVNSKKRQAIYDYLRGVDEHPTAEMIYNRLKPEYPELSLGTVYRNLAVLEEDGLVIRVGSVDGQERYDACLKLHAHFVCDECRRVSDIEIDHYAARLLADVNERCDCAASSFSLTFHGLCAECKSKDN
ncbi:MAG: transcriptional repressor [Eubacteriales bacterium]|nr:transcriptional repressor [Eubacteriales bacterium]